MSLFDEIRLSFCHQRHDTSENNENQCDKCLESLENSFYTIGTQTDEGFNENDGYKCDCEESLKSEAPDAFVINIGTQTDVVDKLTKGTQTKDKKEETVAQYELNKVTVETQTPSRSNIECTKCLECEKLYNYSTKLQSDLNLSRSTVKDLQQELDKYESNLELLDKFLDEGNDRNNYLQTVVQSLQSKLGILEAAVTDQTNRLDVLNTDTCSAECQTEIGNFSYVL